MTYLSTDGNVYPNYPLAPDFQGCGYSDPDHSWEGFLIQHNFGKMDGFLQRPTAPASNPGRDAGRGQHVPDRLLHQPPPRRHRRKAVPDLPVIGALAENYTVLDRYFCSFAGETFPNRFYQHAARTDRDHNNTTHLEAADDLGSALAHAQHPGHPDRRVLLPGPAVPGAVGPEVLPVLAPVRRRRHRRARDPGHHPVLHRHGRPGQPAKRQLRRPRVRHRGQRNLRRRPSRWPTSGWASGSSPTPTTRSPTPVTWTTRSSSSPSTSGAASSTTSRRRTSSTTPTRRPSTTPGTARRRPTAS